jgi:hypothetical protein
MIINRPRLFSVLRKEIPNRRPFTEGTHFKKGPNNGYIIRNNNMKRRQNMVFKNLSLNEKRKEWIRLLNEMKRTPDGMRWFMLYKIYYNRIANKNFVKKIYSGNIPRENEAQFIGKLNRRFENVRNVNPIKNSANLARRIKNSMR